MANEDKKDFNAMLHDNKDMPKFQIITDQKSIEKYGGSKMYFAPPIDYDRVMKKVPYGKVITVGTIREYFAELSGADFTEPITAGIFVSIVASAMLSCGHATARKIGEQAGAKIVIGRRVLYSVEKVKNYLSYLEE